MQDLFGFFFFFSYFSLGQALLSLPLHQITFGEAEGLGSTSNRVRLPIQGLRAEPCKLFPILVSCCICVVDHLAVSVPAGSFVGFCFFLLNHSSVASFCKVKCCVHVCGHWNSQDPFLEWEMPECCCAPAETFRVPWVLCRCELQDLAEVTPARSGEDGHPAASWQSCPC